MLIKILFWSSPAVKYCHPFFLLYSALSICDKKISQNIIVCYSMISSQEWEIETWEQWSALNYVCQPI